MTRLLFIVAIAAAVYWWLKSVRKQPPPRQDKSSRAEDMVRCAECGVHLPKNESFFVGGKYFCSEAHSRGQSDKDDSSGKDD